MPRRIKALFLMVMAVTITILVFTSHIRQTQPRDTRTVQDFYQKTKDALGRNTGGGSTGQGPGRVVVDTSTGHAKGHVPSDKDADGDVDEDDDRVAQEMAERLRAAESQAKELANSKSPNRPDAPSDVVGVGSSAGGQKKGSASSGGDDDGKEEEETDEDHEIEVELDRILKKSPVIIFSKTYCPYSKRAKGLLLEKYVIEPTPYVVELDTHPLGPQLQSRLAELTGQRTVPNIMINGKSIGGSDDVAELDRDRALADKIRTVGGKWIVDVKERFSH